MSTCWSHITLSQALISRKYIEERLENQACVSVCCGWNEYMESFVVGLDGDLMATINLDGSIAVASRGPIDVGALRVRLEKLFFPDPLARPARS